MRAFFSIKNLIRWHQVAMIKSVSTKTPYHQFFYRALSAQVKYNAVFLVFITFKFYLYLLDMMTMYYFFIMVVAICGYEHMLYVQILFVLLYIIQTMYCILKRQLNYCAFYDLIFDMVLQLLVVGVQLDLMMMMLFYGQHWKIFVI
eukprot:TRINITY_DN8006_c1_g3_i1.p2 TRINITY_DN8006_c1_g3~~TRINITY_DN8006_c1_g3_i1.p2  ORF type:complete len:153 (-),score=0.41 TRINITY_DN8006_c1_g3_i1:121-558(-)